MVLVLFSGMLQVELWFGGTSTEKLENSCYIVFWIYSRINSICDYFKLFFLFNFSAKIIQFKQLLSLLAQDLDPKNVLKTLQQVAVLVQGNWVVRSEILYPKDTCSGSSGVPADLMCRGRDYVVST